MFLDNLVSKLLNTSLKGKIGIFLTFVCVFDNFLLQTLQMDKNLNIVLGENMKQIGYFRKIAEVFRNWRPITFSLYLGFKNATEINLATRKDCWLYKSFSYISHDILISVSSKLRTSSLHTNVLSPTSLPEQLWVDVAELCCDWLKDFIVSM